MIDLTDPASATRLILNTISHDELLSPIQIKTLKSHYQDLVAEQSYQLHSKLLNSIQPNFDKLERRVECAVEKSPPMTLKQFIEVPHCSDQPITVCLNIEKVDSGTWMDVICALSTTSLTPGVIEFGEPVPFGQAESKSIIDTKNNNKYI